MTILCALVLVPAVHAASEGMPHAFRIGAGPLDEALEAFGRQAGVQLLYPSELTKGRRANTVTGEFTPAQALRRLLAGTGLVAISDDDRTYVLKAAARPAPPRRGPGASTPGVTEIPAVEARALWAEPSSTTPLRTITAEDIRRQGFSTIAEALTVAPGLEVAGNSASLANVALYQYSGLSSSAGATVASSPIRIGRPVVLVDGIRLLDVGFFADDFTVVQNVSGIPIAWVDCIEVYAPGSALANGPDGMRGAINIVLKKGFKGTAVDASVGESQHGDAKERRLAFMTGRSIGSDTSIVAGMQFLDDDPVFGRDRHWVRSAIDRIPPNTVEYVTAFPVGYEAGKLVSSLGLGRCIAVGPSCVDPSYDASTLQGGSRSTDAYVHLEHSRGPTRFYADLRGSSQSTRLQTAPVYLRYARRSSDSPTGVVFDQIDAPEPLTEASSLHSYAATIGVTGGFSLGEWRAEVSDQRGYYRDRYRGVVGSDDLIDLLRTSRGAPPLDPVAHDLKGIATRSASSRQTSARTSVSLKLPAWGDRFTTVDAGAEFISRHVKDAPADLLVAGSVTQAVTPSDRDLDLSTLYHYGLVSLPITSTFETTMGYGLTRNSTDRQPHANISLSARWSPLSRLSLESSVSRARLTRPEVTLTRPDVYDHPALSVQRPAGTSCRAVDPEATDSCLVHFVSTGDTALKPEILTTQRHDLTWAWTPANTIGLQYTRSRLDRGIRAVSLSPDLPSAFVLDGRGRIAALRVTLRNGISSVSEEIALHAKASGWRLHDTSLSFDAWINYLKRLDVSYAPGEPRVSVAGFRDQPRLTANASVSGTTAGWTTAITVRYVGPYRNDLWAAPSLSDCGPSSGTSCATAGFALFSLASTRAISDTFSVNLRIDNLLDHTPRYRALPGIAYNAVFDDVVGRAFRLTLHWQM